MMFFLLCVCRRISGLAGYRSFPFGCSTIHVLISSPPASLHLLPPLLPPPHNGKSIGGPEKRTPGRTPSARDSNLDGGGGGDAKPSLSLNRTSFAETARMFTLVCSNDQERHAVTTTYRHRFRLELRAVMQERRRNSARFGNSIQHRAESNGNGGSGGCGSNKGVGSSSFSPHDSNHSSKEAQNDPPQPPDAVHAKNTPVAGQLAAAETSRMNKSATRLKWGGAKQNRGEGKEREGPPGDEEKGVTAEEFSEALIRCPEMLEAFGNQLAARFRHRHRPIWMAPFLRKGD